MNLDRFNKSKYKFVAQLSVMACGLLFIRVFKTGSTNYLFLIWNVFLAWIPCLISSLAWKTSYNKAVKFQMKEILFAILWILFLPNAPYIVTDSFHLKPNLLIPMWFDVVIIFSFSLIGLLLMFYSIDDFRNKLFKRIDPKFQKLLLPILFLAVSYGVYLGRYMRSNSWDVIYKPFDLLNDIFQSIFSKNYFKETWSFTFIFALFLYFGYQAFHNIVKHRDINNPK